MKPQSQNKKRIVRKNGTSIIDKTSKEPVNIDKSKAINFGIKINNER